MPPRTSIDTVFSGSDVSNSSGDPRKLPSGVGMPTLKGGAQAHQPNNPDMSKSGPRAVKDVESTPALMTMEPLVAQQAGTVRQVVALANDGPGSNRANRAIRRFTFCTPPDGMGFP